MAVARRGPLGYGDRNSSAGISGVWLSQANAVRPSCPRNDGAGAAWLSMATLSALSCEVLVDGAWRTFGLDEARFVPPGAVMRCPRCHGRVDVRVIYIGQGHTQLRHRGAHDGCPLIRRRYGGVLKRHPEPVE